jgi:hypothetical protein
MIKQNPFSLYDFLGYFIPGALLIYIYLFIEYFNDLKEQFKLSEFLKSNKDFQIESFLFFIILSYALGHLINFISSITVEKYANWKYDYPSKYLLGFKRDTKLLKTLNYRRVILIIIVSPIAILDLILGDLFKFKYFYTRKLDKLLIEVIKEKGLVLINDLYKNKSGNTNDIRLRDYDFHRIFTHYTFENTKNHQFKLVNYVILYGFLRVLSFISIIVFWYFLYLKIIKGNELIGYFHIVLIGLIAYTFYMAFMKFYRRYTLEGFMLIAIDRDLIYKKEK